MHVGFKRHRRTLHFFYKNDQNAKSPENPVPKTCIRIRPLTKFIVVCGFVSTGALAFVRMCVAMWRSQTDYFANYAPMTLLGVLYWSCLGGLQLFIYRRIQRLREKQPHSEGVFFTVLWKFLRSGHYEVVAIFLFQKQRQNSSRRAVGG